MLQVDGLRQHDDLAGMARYQREAAPGGAHAGQLAQHRAQSGNLDPQPDTVQLVSSLRTECPRHQRIPWNFPGPGLAQRAGEREQDWAAHQRDRRASIPHEMTACIHDQRWRRLQRLDVVEQEKALLPTRDQPRRRSVEHARGALDLGHQPDDAGGARGAFCPDKCGACRLRPQASERNPGDHQLVGSPRCRRKGCRVQSGKCRLGLVDAPEQEHTPDLEMARKCRIQPVTMPFERRPRGTQRLRGPAQVTRHEGDLGLGHDTFGAGNCFTWFERARRTSQEGLRSHQIAELRHGDAACQGQCWRVLPQGNPVQGAKRIARRQRPRRGGDQRPMRIPQRLVTPGIGPRPGAIGRPTGSGGTGAGPMAERRLERVTSGWWLIRSCSLAWPNGSASQPRPPSP